MKAFVRTMVLGLAVFSLVGTAGAAEVQKGDVPSLEESRDMAAWQASTEKGFNRQQLKDEEQRLQGLIDALNQGERVDPLEVDRTLNRTR